MPTYKCANKRCKDLIEVVPGNAIPMFCPACRFLARWVFAVCVALAGFVGGALKGVHWL